MRDSNHLSRTIHFCKVFGRCVWLPESAREGWAEPEAPCPLGPAWPLPGGCSTAKDDVLDEGVLPCIAADCFLSPQTSEDMHRLAPRGL